VQLYWRDHAVDWTTEPVPAHAPGGVGVYFADSRGRGVDPQLRRIRMNHPGSNRDQPMGAAGWRGGRKVFRVFMEMIVAPLCWVTGAGLKKLVGTPRSESGFVELCLGLLFYLVLLVALPVAAFPIHAAAMKYPTTEPAKHVVIDQCRAPQDANAALRALCKAMHREAGAERLSFLDYGDMITMTVDYGDSAFNSFKGRQQG
jgi:hypothetical protein